MSIFWVLPRKKQNWHFFFLQKEFNLDVEVIRGVLNSNSWDQQKAKITLLNMEQDKAKDFIAKKNEVERQMKELERKKKEEKKKVAKQLAQKLERDKTENEHRRRQREEDKKTWKKTSRSAFLKKLESAVPNNNPKSNVSKKPTSPSSPNHRPSKDRRYFGVSLDESMTRCEKMKVKHLVFVLMDHLTTNSLDEQGLFRQEVAVHHMTTDWCSQIVWQRITRSRTQARLWRWFFFFFVFSSFWWLPEGDNVNLQKYDCHEIAGCLKVFLCYQMNFISWYWKAYLRELPNPVLTHPFYSDFLQAQRMSNR